MTFHWNHETEEWVGRVWSDASPPTRRFRRGRKFHRVVFSPFETLKRAESGRSPAGSRAARTWNWSSLHMGGTDTRGYLGARAALNVLGLRRCGWADAGVSGRRRVFGARWQASRFVIFRGVTTRRARAWSGRRDAREGTYLWKVGEKRFFKSFTLEPPFFTAFAAFAALAFASSVGGTREMRREAQASVFRVRARRRAAREGASIVARRSGRGDDA